MLRQISSSAVLLARQGVTELSTVPALSALAQNSSKWAYTSHTTALQSPRIPASFFSSAAAESKDFAHGISKNEEPTTEGLPGGKEYNPAPHPSKQPTDQDASYLLMHPVYSKEYVESVKPKHRPPANFLDNLAYYSIQTVRGTFDLITGYHPDRMNREKWLTRIVFLETVAGVPGMMGAMIRHLHSLRLMRRDHGWIHTLLEEAENERMHLLTFLQMKQPGMIMRGLVLATQGIFCNLFFLCYLISPTYCHRMVGYLEEEAVKTYTHLLSDLDAGKVPEWTGAPAPEIAIKYWRLEADATIRDLVLAVRADEACHSHVNHTFAGMKHDESNPFSTGSHTVP